MKNPILSLTLISTFLIVFSAIQPAWAAKKTQRVTKTLSLANISDIKLETENGSINVKPYDGQDLVADIVFEVMASASSRTEELLDKTRVTADRDSNRVDVIADLPKTRSGETVKADITVRIPGSWTGSYDLRTGNGNMSMVGLSGRALLHTTNGNLSVHDWNGALDATTINGSITVDRITLIADSTVHTTNGNISLGLGSPTFGMSAVSTNGRIKAQLAPGSNVNLDTNTINGRIILAGWGLDISSKGTLKTKLGSGGAILKLQVNNGEIRVTDK